MAKLHELLAVESQTRNQAEATRTELMATFEKKRQHFSELLDTFKSATEGELDVQDKKLTMQTNVIKELEWLSGYIVKALDLANQIDEANTVARADVLLEDGTKILSNMPATALLQLEHRLNDLNAFVKSIPTLDPSKDFRPAPEHSDNVYKAKDVVKNKTEKQQQFISVAAATKEFAEQVREVSRDIVKGQVLTQEWSGFIPVSDKGHMLDRLEELTRAVKAARSRANNQDVDPKANKIGATVTNYVFFGKNS